jgi:hypothetical protein
MTSYESIASSMKADGQLDYTLVTEELIGPTWTPSNITNVRADGPFSGHYRIPGRTPLAAMDEATREAALASARAAVFPLGQQALAAALEKATQPGTLALVSAAEIDKTASLVRQCAGLVNAMAAQLERLGPSKKAQLNSFLRRYGLEKGRLRRKQLLRGLSKDLSQIASSWLGYRYGVMTTYYDVLSWVSVSKGDQRRKRVTSSLFDSYNNEVDWHVTYESAQALEEKRSFYRRRSDISAGVLIVPEAVSTADRFGANRILSTAWELVPFSFVIDWVLDTGTRIAAHEGSYLIKPLGSWIKYSHEFTIGDYYRETWKDTTIGSTRRYAYGADVSSVIERTVMNTRIANPKLSFFPQVRVKLNWERVADSVALLAGAASRMRRSVR